MEGFILGLTNGTVCAAYCIPAFASYLLKGGKETRQNYFVFGQFMTGRFIGYLLFSILAWVVGITIFQDSKSQDLFFGVTYVILSVLLIFYGAYGPSSACALKSFKTIITNIGGKFPSLLPLAMGFIIGLNICPPFLLAFTRASTTGTLSGSMLFFVMFFLGTSIYFIPVPLLGAFNRHVKLQTIGKYSVYAMSFFYLALGFMMIINGAGIGLSDFDPMKFKI